MPTTENSDTIIDINNDTRLAPIRPDNSNPLANSPRINYFYERVNNSKLAKFSWALCVSYGMAAYNFRKEVEKGNLSAGISSASVSLICNILVSYEFCLKSPFLAAAVLSEIHKNPKLSLVVVSALISSGALTAQLIHEQPVAWQVAIGTSAFLNYAATRLAGLIDNDRSLASNAFIGSVGLATFFPLVYIWLTDTASLFSSPSIPKMITTPLAKGAYVAGSTVAIFGAIGSFITTLFYCQAISSVPKKVKLLYEAWCDLLEKDLGLGANSSKLLGGFLALITAASLSYVGYYSMAGFYLAILTALECTSVSGELCWLTQALDLSSIWIDVLATFQQVITGMVNASALIPAFTKFLKLATIQSGSSTNNSALNSSINSCAFFDCCKPKAVENEEDDDSLLAYQASPAPS